jgi:very-short-patch-repair endonuclease
MRNQQTRRRDGIQGVAAPWMCEQKGINPMGTPRKGTPEHDEWRRKISEANKGKDTTPPKGTPEYDAWRGKISESLKGNVPWNKGKKTGQIPHNKGVPMSDETKAKVSAAKKGTPRSQEARDQAAAPNRGRKRTPEQRARMSAANKGRKPSPETVEKIAAARRGKPSNRKGATFSEESRRKLSEAKKGHPGPIGTKHDAAFSARVSASNKRRWQTATEEQKRAHLDKLHKTIITSQLEEIVAAELDQQGVQYERQWKIGWYRVDFYVPATNTIIEANGCYWHQCQQCGFNDERLSEQREKDEKRYEYLQRKGYTLKIVWEHEFPDQLRIRRRGASDD